MTKLKDELTRLHGEVGRLEASLRGSLVNQHLADIVGGARGRLADAVAHPDADTDMEKPAAPQPIAEIKPGDDVDAQLKTDLEAAKAKTDAADAKHLELLRQEQAKASAAFPFTSDAAAKADLRTDGPTVAEYVAAGYSPRSYPPGGYAPKSTAEEITAAVAAEDTRLSDHG